jgi:CubicO group peptidase (beta-lactamase class C family)
MQLVRNDSLRFEPGTQWSYSNTGMLVAGKVVEIASGMDYDTYVRARITRPAGMTNTDTYDLEHVTRNLAVGYDPVPGSNPTAYRNNIFMHVIRGGPAGGGYSTVDDLWRFATALRGGQLVSADAVRLLTTPKPELRSPSYGYGFQLFDQGRFVGHSGGFPGICSELDMDMQDHYVIVVLSNYSEGCGPVIEKARSLILRGSPPR